MWLVELNIILYLLRQLLQLFTLHCFSMFFSVDQLNRIRVNGHFNVLEKCYCYWPILLFTKFRVNNCLKSHDKFNLKFVLKRSILRANV